MQQMKMMLTIQAKLRCGVNHTLHCVLESNLLPSTNMMVNIVSAKE